MATLRRIDLLRVFGRSLWLQASWSFDGMQSLGFAYALDPALGRLYGEGEARARARKRHLEFFNTHPFMASAILGCAARLEADGGPDAEEATRRMKNALMGPYGAVGDGLFWGGIEPLLVLLCLHAGFRGYTWAPWALVGLFTTANLAGRAYLFLQGYRSGMGIVDVVNRLNPLRVSRRLKTACVVVLGALLLPALPAEAVGEMFFPWVGAAGALGLALVLAWAFRGGVHAVWVVYLMFALSLCLSVWS